MFCKDCKHWKSEPQHILPGLGLCLKMRSDGGNRRTKPAEILAWAVEYEGCAADVMTRDTFGCVMACARMVPVVPGRGDLMTFEEFIVAVNGGALIDDDGFGHYATATKVSGLVVHPSDLERGHLDSAFTHVLWFNR